MNIQKFDVWIADLNPRRGTEPGKVRPVVVVQTDLLNGVHPSTIICPVTTRITAGAGLLRVHLPRKRSGLPEDSDILVDQIRAIDNRRLTRKTGTLTPAQREKLMNNLHLLILE